MGLLRELLARPFQHRITPSFLILGAEKGGTTFFFHHLGQHLRIATPPVKEICFFDRNANFDRGIEWYRQQFPAVWRWSSRLTFEATPSYLYYHFVAARIAEYAPEMKLIIMLRDPVLRAYSAWNMHRQIRIKNWDFVLNRLESQPDSVRRSMLEYYDIVEATDFSGAVRELIPKIDDERIEPGLLKRGLYARQIAEYRRHFPAEQMLILESASCRKNPSAELDRVADFLGIDRIAWDAVRVADVHHHKREYEAPIPEDARQMLRALYHLPNEELFELLGYRYPWND